MERIAKAPLSQPAILSTTLSSMSELWSRFVRYTAPYNTIGLYGEEIAVNDAFEREMNAARLHPYT